VHFNLAQNKTEPGRPFAFMATYTTRLSAQARAQHVPLGQGWREYAGANKRDKLLALLAPVQRAAETCAWLKVSGSDIHDVTVKVTQLPAARWRSIRADCVGGIDSLVERPRARFTKGLWSASAARTATFSPGHRKSPSHASAWTKRRCARTKRRWCTVSAPAWTNSRGCFSDCEASTRPS
jgi:hypothetical protein